MPNVLKLLIEKVLNHFESLLQSSPFLQKFVFHVKKWNVKTKISFNFLSLRVSNFRVNITQNKQWICSSQYKWGSKMQFLLTPVYMYGKCFRSVQFKRYLFVNYQMQITYINKWRLKKHIIERIQPIQAIVNWIDFYTF